MKTYHETAGRRSENTVGFTFDADPRRREFILFDVYCDNPDCTGWESKLSLIALEPEEHRIEFEVNPKTGEMSASRDTSDVDLAIAQEFCSANENWNLLLRRRQLVRAWALAHREGRRGPKRRFTGACYAFRDFDKHKEPFIIPFTYEGESWSMMDQYCAHPSCPCTKALLSFYHHRPGDTVATPSFGVRLELADGSIEHDEDHGGPLSPAHRKVVEHFLAESPDWKHELAQRRDLLRKIVARRVQFPPDQPPRPPGTATAELILRAVEALRPTRPTPAGAAAASTPTPSPATVPASVGASSSPEAPVRAAKIGRNAPCPCGSGRKYKKCCGKATP